MTPYQYDDDPNYNLDDKIKDIEIKLEEIYINIDEIKFSKEEYEIYLYPTTINRYIINLINLQHIKGEWFHPRLLPLINIYFRENLNNFDYNLIKYGRGCELNIINRIIAYQGRSGVSYIENLKHIININKPLLLFYGIEQMSAYYSNLHFNFTWKNENLSSVRRKFFRHGLNSFEFKNDIDLDNQIEDMLNKKIRLEKTGLAQRFFLAFNPRFLNYFNERLEFSLLDLLRLFYLSTPVHYKVKEQFITYFGREIPDSIKIRGYGSDLFVIYLLSFLFCHLCRYKLYAWTILLESDEKNVGYFIKFFLKFSETYFIKRIFDSVYENEQSFKNVLRRR